MTNYYDVIPEHMMSSIKDYLERGTELGSFLDAVFQNKFSEACCRADEYNVTILRVYAKYLYNECPASSWGSFQEVQDWMASRREGLKNGI